MSNDTETAREHQRETRRQALAMTARQADLMEALLAGDFFTPAEKYILERWLGIAPECVDGYIIGIEAVDEDWTYEDYRPEIYGTELPKELEDVSLADNAWEPIMNAFMRRLLVDKLKLSDYYSRWETEFAAWRTKY